MNGPTRTTLGPVNWGVIYQEKARNKSSSPKYIINPENLSSETNVEKIL